MSVKQITNYSHWHKIWTHSLFRTKLLSRKKYTAWRRLHIGWNMWIHNLFFLLWCCGL